jgi:hypothetical protein
VYFGKTPCAIRKADLGYSFELSPPKAAVQLAEPKPNAHRAANGDWLNVANLTDDREPHRSGTSDRDFTGRTRISLVPDNHTPRRNNAGNGKAYRPSVDLREGRR